MPEAPTQREPLLSRVDAAKILGIHPATLAVWHSTKRHIIPVVKVGARAMYRAADIEAFIKSRTVGAEVSK